MEAQLQGKKIIVAISGSIAAYKTAVLIRLLIKEGANISILMTESAKSFISPLTLGTLGKCKVYSDLMEDHEWSNHVKLGLWADYMIIAPATANSLAKMANGVCDNIIMAVYLSAKCKVGVAPAMDLDMWKHPSTIRNIEQLKKDGVSVIPVGFGELASGLVGDGRMAEPDEIVDFLKREMTKQADFLGKNILITAGPTYEAIDPVRFIGNYSSGKMGFAIAKEFLLRGANVILVCGPSNIKPPNHQNLTVEMIESAQQMHDVCIKHFQSIDCAVLAAAVADYRPEEIATEKIKKNSEELTLKLVKNKDIAAALNQIRKKGQILIGFALETNNEVEYARQKLVKKGFDFIVLNSLKDSGAGFAHDTNLITIIDKENNMEFPLSSKYNQAINIIDEIKRRFYS